ncbi:Fucose-1-phosphate guanylyltransferase [Actinidia chinensis var. chinensis]|uniref:Fucose-1-phosphate guanylyltransferase n=1 Tax=Actinidia chinensis var. chinensis TaxID=1590841 RepID=A0A2R6Q7N7_ACTCC|nr:Fucose-1-phosphate guanylyltransferase [Actinidia chinensis var. chinensis]
MGRIAGSTVTLAVPDPNGKRIGSGAATLNAIHALARHYWDLGLDISPQVANGNDSGFGSSVLHDKSNNEFPLLPIFNFTAKRHILLLHAGSESKRVLWANPMGKVFLPLPYLASDDPDGPVPLLFDHILAVSACARQAFKHEGGIFIMTGDVLPCFDASTLTLPEDTSCIITFPITLDIASNHGVIVASKTVVSDGTFSNRTLLDTDIIAVRGKAWEDLAMLSCSCEPLILELLKSRKEMSLYEDLVAAWVPARHEWLRSRPLGQELVNRLGQKKMFSYCAYDFSFLHFGTSSEVLDHLSGASSELVGRRHLCSIPATTVSDIAASAIILSSKIAPGVSIGEDSLIYDSSILGGVQIGSQSIVVGVNMPIVDNGAGEEPLSWIAKACLNFGLLGRNLSQLCEEILQKEPSGFKTCKDFLALCPNLQAQNSKILPKSRAYQIQVDLFRACGNETAACELEHKVWTSVSEETASAVRYDFKEHLYESSNRAFTKANHSIEIDGLMDKSLFSRTAKVELPVRVDFVGSWSDTPPWSLERAGFVLNMAVTLEDSLPIGTIIKITKTTGVLISDDAGNELFIEDCTSIATPFDNDDPFGLVNSALLVTGIVHDKILLSMGLQITTLANVPRVSGLGTSSILAAAVVKGLLQITDGDESNENVARLVLVLEQLMGTGGGWQDQIGGLYPGIKFTASFPGVLLWLQVIPLLASPQLIRELQQRLLVVFTGQVRASTPSPPKSGNPVSPTGQPTCIQYQTPYGTGKDWEGSSNEL